MTNRFAYLHIEYPVIATAMTVPFRCAMCSM